MNSIQSKCNAVTYKSMNSNNSNLNQTSYNPKMEHIHQRPPSPSSPSSPSSLTRNEALEQANQVINSTSYQQRQFENFNLLGVVTTPISLQERSNHALTMSSSMHGHGGGRGHARITSEDDTKNNTNNATDPSSSSSSSSSSTTDILSTMSSSLSKEIESINSTIYNISKTYLGHYPTLSNTYINSIVNHSIHMVVSGTSSIHGDGSGSSSSRNGYSTSRHGNNNNNNNNNTTTMNGSARRDSMSSIIPSFLDTSSSTSSSSSSLDYEQELLSSIINEGGEYHKIRPLNELSTELVELDLSSVEKYLRKCGMLAHKLDRELKMDSYDYDVGGIGSIGGDGGKGEGEDPLLNIPEIFFSPFFDLTDPKTFESLLVLNDDDDYDDNDSKNDDDGNVIISNNNNNNKKTPKTSNKNTKSKKNQDPIINIPKPEQLTQYLDTIELAILNQVRSKSDSFFRETNRFSYLKSLVADLVSDVQHLRSQLDIIREKSVVDVEMIPVLDRRRKDVKVLGEVLDEIVDVVDVKGSVVGLIASGDLLGAVEAIQMARSLLNGDSGSAINDDYGGDGDDSDNYTDNDGNGAQGNGIYEDDQKDAESNDNGKKRKRYALGKIVALNKVNDQLAQYEHLVVMDLSNDVIELFLTWNDDAVSTDMRVKVKQTIVALKKCKNLSTMADLYREKLCETIRVTIRTTVTECAVDAAKDSTEASMIPSATIVHIPNKDGGNETHTKTSITEGVTSMNFEEFMDCLDMIFEQSLTLLQSAAAVNKFCLEEGISLKENENSRDASALSAASDLSHKSISEILRLRKDAHSLITFEDMRRLWDSCLAFTLQVEKISGQKAYGLRSTLLAQAKAFVERKHEANMSNLVAALDGERWNQCDVSSERQASLERLCTGRAVLSIRGNRMLNGVDASETTPFASVEGTKYRVVWSCLLLIEHIMSNVACAAHFQTLATNVVGKVSELLRLFNARATQLVLGAGAIHSAARLKSINAKHLALVTQCVGIVLAILPHVRAALMAQLPNKQHTLLVDLDKIKKEYAEHHDKVLNKFVGIIGGIVEHNLIHRISNTNFDQRAKLPHVEELNSNTCCPFIDGVFANTRKMHQVLVSLLPSDDFMNVFSRIFSYLDSKVPKMLIDADADEKIAFQFPTSVEGKQRLVMEVKILSSTLNGLPNVRQWDFGSMKFLERKLELPSQSEEGDKDNVEEVEDNKEQSTVTTNESADDGIANKSVDDSTDNDQQDDKANGHCEENNNPNQIQSTSSQIEIQGGGNVNSDTKNVNLAESPVVSKGEGQHVDSKKDLLAACEGKGDDDYFETPGPNDEFDTTREETSIIDPSIKNSLSSKNKESDLDEKLSVDPDEVKTTTSTTDSTVVTELTKDSLGE